jgi:hypothetical protein
MAAKLKQPGTEQGACISNCSHLDCLSVRQIAAERCRVCQERIGYERNYYAESQSFVHENCLQEELAKKTSAGNEPVVFLEVEEVATLLRSTVGTITQWVSQNKIPYRKANGKTLFLLDEILNWTMPNRSKKERPAPRLEAAK